MGGLAALLVRGLELIFGQLTIAIGVDFIEVLDELFCPCVLQFFARQMAVAVGIGFGEALAAFGLTRRALAFAVGGFCVCEYWK